MKVDDHQYANVFLEEVTLYEAVEEITRLAYGFVVNLIASQGLRKRPLWEWISYLLDWAEYTDFMEWKAEVGRDRIIPKEVEDKYIEDVKKTFGDDYFERMYPNG